MADKRDQQKLDKIPQRLQRFGDVSRRDIIIEGEISKKDQKENEERTVVNTVRRDANQ